MKTIFNYKKLLIVFSLVCSMISYVYADQFSHTDASYTYNYRVEFISTGEFCPICDSDLWAIAVDNASNEILAQQCTNCSYSLFGQPFL